MGIAPLCYPCERSTLEVSPDYPLAAKAKCGRMNASEVVEVGEGGLVASALLDPDPIKSSVYDGQFREITVIAVYPVSEWVPPQNGEDGYWSRTRSITKTWIRTHDGENIIPCSSPKTFEETYEQEGYPLADNETIIYGKDEDPDLYGPGFLSLLDSSIETSGEIVKEDLIAYVSELPEEWSTYFDVAPPEFAILGVSSGIILWGGYEEEDKPYQASNLVVKWTATATHGIDVLPSISAYHIGEPGLILKSTASVNILNLTLPEPTEELDQTFVNQMPWRKDSARWSKAANLADPDTEDWEYLNSDTTPGILRILNGYQYALDVGPMLLI